MGNIARKLYQRVTNFGLAFMLAASSLAVVGPFLAAESVGAIPFTTYKLTAQPNNQTIEAGTGVAAINVFAEWKSFIGGWNDFNSLLSATTISAQSDTAEVSTDQASWYSSVDLTSPRYYSAEGDFYVKSNVVGTHTINFSATIETTEGMRDLVTTATVTVEDTVAPGVATNPSPADGSVLNMTTLRAMGLSWTAPYDESVISFEYGVTKAENKDELWPHGGFVWTIPNYNGSDRPGSSTPVPDNDLPDGDYYWQVRYTDAAGNVGPWSEWKFTIDSTAPTITWQLQPLAIYGGGQGFHVRPITPEVGTNKSVYIDSVDSSNLCYNVDSDHKNMDTKNNHCQDLWNSLSDGAHKFIAVFTDRAGNTTESSSNSFIIDRTGPTVTVKDGYVGSLADKIFSNVSFQLYDPYQVDKYVINSHTSNFTDNKWSDANFQNIKSHLVEGNNTLTLYDVAGNSTTYEFVYDATAPSTPEINTPTSEQYFNTSPISNKWSVSTDNLSGVKGYQIAYQYDDGHSFGGDNTCAGETAASLGIGVDGKFIGCRDVTNTQRNHSPSTGEQGGVTIWVRAQDKAGNWSEWSNPVHYYYDSIAPVAAITSHIESEVVNGVVTVTGEATDATSGIKSHWFEITGPNGYIANFYQMNATGDSYSFTWDTSALEDGEYKIRYVATDVANNRSDDPNYSNPTIRSVIVANTPVVIGDYFVADANGLNVGFTVDRFTDAESVTVGLYDENDNLIVENFGDSTDILNLINTNTLTEISSPFYIPVVSTDDGYWQFGSVDWRSVDKPAYAIVTIVYGGGEVESEPILLSGSTEGGEYTYEAHIANLPPVVADPDGSDAPEEGDPEADPSEGAGTEDDLTPPDSFIEEDEPAVEGAQDENGDQDVAAAQDDNTNGDENENNGTIFGLAWYWWLAILAAIAAAWWLIAGALRRRNNEEA